MKEDIIRLCSEIKVNNKCSNCGGDFSNHTCRYCGNDSQVLEKLINELCFKLVNLNDYDNDILNALYSIRSMNIKIVNDLINYLMKKLLIFELVELDIQDILILIKKFTEMFMEGKVNAPKCIYQDLDEGTLGKAFGNTIVLNEDDITQMIKVMDFEGILQLVFHECTHTTQRYMLNDNWVGYNMLIQVKETMLRSIISGYYGDNYSDYNSEVEARFLERILHYII